MSWRLLRLERLVARLRKYWVSRRKESRQVYVQDRVREFRTMWSAVAEAVGAQFCDVTEQIWEIRRGAKRTRISNYKLEIDNPVILEIAGNKPLVYRLLSEAGLRVPEHRVFELGELHVAEAFLQSHPRGCVIKPADGTSSGLGVTTHVLSRCEVRKAAVLASLYHSKLLIEEMISGESYRLLVFEGEVIHAVRRRCPRLIADGVSSVAELIAEENARRHGRCEAAIEIDRDCRFTLESQALSLSAIPPKGGVFAVQSVGDPERRQVEVRTIYNEPATDLICETLKRDAESVAAILGSRFLGVDIVTSDPSVPLGQSAGAIIEANTTPGLHHHYDMRREQYPEAARVVIKTLLDR